MGQFFSKRELSLKERQEIIYALENHDKLFTRGVSSCTSLHSKDHKFLAIVESYISGDEYHVVLTNKKGDFLLRVVSGAPW